MESERVILVCLKNRTQEGRLESDGNTAALFSLSVLDQAVRAKFADLPSLSDTSQLILQVGLKFVHDLCVSVTCMIACLCVPGE